MKQFIRNRKMEEVHMKLVSNNKKGMEMVQVAILVAIAIGLGLMFRESIGEFLTRTFKALLESDFT